MEGKVIVLPNKDEMLKRLIAVCDENHFQERFYPILLQRAGTELVAEGVVLMLALAIEDYTAGLPTGVKHLMYLRINDFIDALVDDQDVAQEAKDFMEEAMQAGK